MKVKELIKKLKSQDGEKEVFIRVQTPTGNIAGIDKVRKSTYGFFGKSIPCIILER